MADKANIDAELFLPYYINQPRLLDIYAILNGGYSEYEEIESLASSESKKARSGSINGKTGFRLFKVGADISGIDEDNVIGHDKSNIKLVQTATSMLDIVISSLRSQGFITDIRDSSEGSFVITTINAKINKLNRELRKTAQSDEEDEVINLMKEIASIIENGMDWMTEFDEVLFESLVEKIIVKDQITLEFYLYGGLKFTERLV